MNDNSVHTLRSSLKDQHIIWQTQLKGHLTYGPTGKKIKNNLECIIRQYFEMKSFMEIETPLLLSKDIWVRSKHWDTFREPVIKYKINDKIKVLRLDKLLEEKYNVDYNKQTTETIYKLLKDDTDVAYILPDTSDDYTIEYKNLMMTSTSGNSVSGLRPETATSTYHNFMDIYECFNKIYPIKIYQIGKSFRNEISTKLLLRTREFTQAEFHIILPFKNKNNLLLDSVADLRQLLELLGIPIDKIRIKRHNEDNRVFYAKDAYDIEVNLNGHGWTEICGIHDRGDYDLSHFELDETPHIIEMSIGIDRLLYAIFDTRLVIRNQKAGKSMLKLTSNLSPYKYSIAVIARNKPDIMQKAEEVYAKLGPIQSYFHRHISVGKAYYQSGIMGICTCITIDYQTLEDNTVTIRDRDTGDQHRINIGVLL